MAGRYQGRTKIGASGSSMSPFGMSPLKRLTSMLKQDVKMIPYEYAVTSGVEDMDLINAHRVDMETKRTQAQTYIHRRVI